MADSILDHLLSDEFQARAGGLSTAPALRLFLIWQPEVRRVAEAIRNGAVTEDAIGDFTERLIRHDLKKGQLFPHDIPIAALAVALEERATRFAAKFLSDLAALRLAEMPLSIRVAKEVWNHRKQLAVNVTRVELTSPLKEPILTAAEPPRRNPEWAAKQVKSVLCEG